MTTIDPTRAAEPTPGVQAFLSFYESLDLPELHELSPERAREVQEQIAQLSPGISLSAVEDWTIEGPGGELPLRLYEPRDEPTEKAPLVLYFHGGGWVVGSLDTHDGVCRKLAAETGYPVVSVDYRLAPEHPFPAALRDCYRALEWATETAPELDADPERVALAGDSAGGNLAAATALLARDEDGPSVAYQALVYPATGDPRETQAYAENAEGYFLPRETMEWFADQYLDDDIDIGNIYARPRLAADLSELPPATIVTGGFDPLRDDGAAYARRLDEAGVSVCYHNYSGQIHGFFNMIADPVDLPDAHDAHERVAADLQNALD
jgi:acetyl esterase